jgi:hypothetical protein
MPGERLFCTTYVWSNPVSGSHQTFEYFPTVQQLTLSQSNLHQVQEMVDIEDVSKIVKLQSILALVRLSQAHLGHTRLVWISQDVWWNVGLSEYT